MHAADAGPLPPGNLASLVPAARHASTSIVEIRPVDRFVTYGIGIPLLRMRVPDLARASVTVE